MKQRAAELKAQKSAKNAQALEANVLGAIAEMAPADRVIAERIHAIVKEVAPQLGSKTWYGFPAYTRDDKVVLHFQPAAKFNTRFPTFGFSDAACLDDGTMWPVAFAITALTKENEQVIADLIRKAAG